MAAEEFGKPHLGSAQESRREKKKGKKGRAKTISAIHRVTTEQSKLLYARGLSHLEQKIYGSLGRYASARNLVVVSLSRLRPGVRANQRSTMGFTV